MQKYNLICMYVYSKAIISLITHICLRINNQENVMIVTALKKNICFSKHTIKTEYRVTFILSHSI